jgi:hypothetical protein
MKSAPYRLSKAGPFLFVSIFILMSPIIGNGQHFPVPGTFLYATLVRHNQIFDIRDASPVNIGLSRFVRSLDPATGLKIPLSRHSSGYFSWSESRSKAKKCGTTKTH